MCILQTRTCVVNMHNKTAKKTEFYFCSLLASFVVKIGANCNFCWICFLSLVQNSSHSKTGPHVVNPLSYSSPLTKESNIGCGYHVAHTHTHLHTYVRTYACIYTHMHTHNHVLSLYHLVTYMGSQCQPTLLLLSLDKGEQRCSHTHTHTHTHTCTLMCVLVCIRVCMHILIYTREHALFLFHLVTYMGSQCQPTLLLLSLDKGEQRCSHTHTHTHTHLCVYLYVYVYAHTYIHTWACTVPISCYYTTNIYWSPLYVPLVSPQSIPSLELPWFNNPWHLISPSTLSL